MTGAEQWAQVQRLAEGRPELVDDVSRRIARTLARRLESDAATASGWALAYDNAASDLSRSGRSPVEKLEKAEEYAARVVAIRRVLHALADVC